MPVYGAGSKYLDRTEKETEWRRFHAPQAPGNSHCTPIDPGNSHCTPTTTEKSVGTVKMTNETKQVGATLEVKSEAKADTPAGTVALKTETIEGTVTVFTAGRMIEVMTGEKKMHRFSLDDKDAAYSVDGTVAVGKRLTITDEIGADRVRRITVRSRA